MLLVGRHRVSLIASILFWDSRIDAFSMLTAGCNSTWRACNSMCIFPGCNSTWRACKSPVVPTRWMSTPFLHCLRRDTALFARVRWEFGESRLLNRCNLFFLLNNTNCTSIKVKVEIASMDHRRAANSMEVEHRWSHHAALKIVASVINLSQQHEETGFPKLVFPNTVFQKLVGTTSFWTTNVWQTSFWKRFWKKRFWKNLGKINKNRKPNNQN